MSDTADDTPDSEITERMMGAGMAALRRLDLKNPVYANRRATVEAIYRVMRGAKAVTR